MDAGSLKKILEQAVSDWNRVEEIRIRSGRPVFLLEAGEERELPAVADDCLIREILEIGSGHSLYAFEEEIRQGFLTIRGGHRIGLAGRAVVLPMEGSGNGEGGIGLRTIRDISSLNIRLAHEAKGCADALLPRLLDSSGELYHTLLISPPGAGKTTMLRDLVRQLSDGETGGAVLSGPEKQPGTRRAGVSVGVVDERSEIGACYHGLPQCDLGKRTDIMDACPKTVGIGLLLRSMAPQVLAVDEAGSAADFEALRSAATCGCRLLATVHGSSMEDLRRKPVLAAMLRERIFERYVVLAKKPKPGTVAGIFDEAGEEQPMRRGGK